MRQLGNVSIHNEHKCLSQDATKPSFPVVCSERPGKGKEKQKPTTIQRAHCFEYSPKI